MALDTSAAARELGPFSTQELFPLIYHELRRLAARKMAREAPGKTLQATSLVHEVFIRLTEKQGRLANERWQSRSHFFVAAGEAMRKIIVDRARRKASIKRGGRREREPFDAIEITVPALSYDVLAVDEALEEFQAVDAAAAEVVKLRFFAGFTLPETAELLEISPRTADRLWAYARAWLRRRLSE